MNIDFVENTRGDSYVSFYVLFCSVGFADLIVVFSSTFLTVISFVSAYELLRQSIFTMVVSINYI